MVNIKFVFSFVINVLGFLAYHTMMPLNFTTEVNKRSEAIRSRCKKLHIDAGLLFER